MSSITKNKLSTQLKKLKRKEIHVPGDGNCQFHTIVYSLKKYNIQFTHTTLRHLAICYIKYNKDFYKDFIWDMSLRQYIKNLKHGEYGDHITLDALADIFDLRIKVLYDRKPPTIINKTGKHRIVIIYRGDDDNHAHYNPTKKL